jgi:hypothetical protein
MARRSLYLPVILAVGTVAILASTFVAWGASATSAIIPPFTSQSGQSSPAASASVPTYVILVHGFDPAVMPATFWTYGVNMYSQLVHAGYIVGIVSYYGGFTLTLSNGVKYTDSTFYGTVNTPIESIGHEVGLAIQHVLAGKKVNLDIVGHSMGGLVTMSMLENIQFSHVTLKNIVYLASPLNGAPLSAASGYVNMSGYEAQEMESGSPFLTKLAANSPIISKDYPSAHTLAYAGDANPVWANSFFGGPNDGLVSVASATHTTYYHSYEFPDLHMPSLDVYDPGYVSYFEDQNVANELLSNFQGHY